MAVLMLISLALSPSLPLSLAAPGASPSSSGLPLSAPDAFASAWAVARAKEEAAEKEATCGDFSTPLGSSAFRALQVRAALSLSRRQATDAQPSQEAGSDPTSDETNFFLLTVIRLQLPTLNQGLRDVIPQNIGHVFSASDSQRVCCVRGLWSCTCHCDLLGSVLVRNLTNVNSLTISNVVDVRTHVGSALDSPDLSPDPQLLSPGAQPRSEPRPRPRPPSGGEQLSSASFPRLGPPSADGGGGPAGAVPAALSPLLNGSRWTARLASARAALLAAARAPQKEEDPLSLTIVADAEVLGLEVTGEAVGKVGACGRHLPTLRGGASLEASVRGRVTLSGNLVSKGGSMCFVCESAEVDIPAEGVEYRRSAVHIGRWDDAVAFGGQFWDSLVHRLPTGPVVDAVAAAAEGAIPSSLRDKDICF